MILQRSADQGFAAPMSTMVERIRSNESALDPYGAKSASGLSGQDNPAQMPHAYQQQTPHAYQQQTPHGYQQHNQGAHPFPANRDEWDQAEMAYGAGTERGYRAAVADSFERTQGSAPYVDAPPDRQGAAARRHPPHPKSPHENPTDMGYQPAMAAAYPHVADATFEPPVSPDLGGDRGDLTVFFAAAGGTGATTLACNVAATLARSGRSTCVVDLDLQLGSVLTVLGEDPRCPMSRLARDMESFDWEMLGPMLPRHGAGVSVVSQVGHLEELDELRPRRLPRLLRYLQQHFDHVIVDGVRDFNDHALAALDVADQVVLVLGQDVQSVHGTTRRMTVLRKLGYPLSKTRLVVNRYSDKAPVDLAAIGGALGRSPDFTVANDFAMVQAAITGGATLHQTAPRSPVSVDLDHLAGGLFGLPPVPPPPSAWSRVAAWLGPWFRAGKRPRSRRRAFGPMAPTYAFEGAPGADGQLDQHSAPTPEDVAWFYEDDHENR